MNVQPVAMNPSRLATCRCDPSAIVRLGITRWDFCNIEMIEARIADWSRESSAILGDRGG